VAIGYSGIVVVDNAQTMRELYQASGEVQIQNDTALADYSRLTLEVGALTNLQSIEQIATKELGMEFPETIGRVIEQVQQ
jgi:cell division protein FtsL